LLRLWHGFRMDEPKLGVTVYKLNPTDIEEGLRGVVIGYWYSAKRGYGCRVKWQDGRNGYHIEDCERGSLGTVEDV
jgi:hypothetical protein